MTTTLNPNDPKNITEHISRVLDPAAWQAHGITSGELTLEMHERRQRSLSKAEQIIYEIDKYRFLKHQGIECEEA